VPGVLIDNADSDYCRSSQSSALPQTSTSPAKERTADSTLTPAELKEQKRLSQNM